MVEMATHGCGWLTSTMAGGTFRYGNTAEQGMGCDVFINELIPHIDSTYRTIAERSGRGIEGFSQGEVKMHWTLRDNDCC